MAARPLLATAAAVVLALGAAACGSDDDAESVASTQVTTAAEQPSGTGDACRRVPAPAPKPDGGQDQPTVKLDPKKTYTASVFTSCGTFEIALDVENAPKTSASFVSLAQDKFYDDTIFHRIVPEFVIQGGDPTGEGMGGPGYSVVEPPDADVKYTRGMVAMAKTEVEEPGTSGSQFYVVTGADAQLPPDYAVLGKVTKGMEAVQRIGIVATDPATEKPIDPVVLERVTIRES